MPNLPMHIYLADQVARQLDRGNIHDHVGSFFLGATAPDIRAMTKWPRERTHFAPLSVDEIGTGARTMLRLYPELAGNAGLSLETQAFVLGYITHLVADEVWITSVFRPYFDGPTMVTPTDVEAHIWDRALQLDMDRKTLPEIYILKPTEAMSCAGQGVEVGFLESDVLREWRDWVCRFMGWEFNWDRLKRTLNRIYRDNDGVQGAVDQFLREMPYSLERVYQRIPEAEVDSYQRRALEETLAQVREYLNGA